MDLLLEIISHQRHSMPAERSQYTFKATGGTIGRNADCDWQIDDPERLISGVHSSIVFDNHCFYIHDNSTNGLFVNDLPHPLGEQVHPISNGDRFALGQFEIRASLINQQNRAVYSSLQNSSLQNSSLQDHSLENHAAVSNGHDLSHQNVPLFPEANVHELDPLARLNEEPVAGRMASGDILAEPDPVNSILDPVAFSQSYIELPNAIPEDWHQPQANTNQRSESSYSPSVGDFNDFKNDFNNDASSLPNASSPQTNSFNHEDNGLNSQANSFTPENIINSTHAVSAMQEQVEPVHIKEVPIQSQPVNYQNNDLVTILLDTLGIDPKDIQEEKLPELIKNIGLITKHSMQGVMQTMNARAHLKNEFRMERTTIKTEKNNPLKFCINYEQLVHYMLTHPVPGYLDSKQSVQEAFNELQEHQIAVMSGMKSALMYMLKKLSPEKIQQKSDKTISLTLSNKKTRYWETYKELYEDIMSEDDVFNHVFGNEFCRAYEQQVEQLRQGKNQVI